MPKKGIRPIAVAIIKNENKFFAGAGFDEDKKEKFYRLMGGGIKFRETALQALMREFKEEFAAELINIKLLGIAENIYVYNGEYGHEIAYVYEADFEDQGMYEDKEYPVLDSPRQEAAGWIEYNETLRIYPKTASDLMS
ncbi:MAG: NUDIX domain-containing protein [Candidatus Falkowbacteria bacterium]